MFLIAFDLFMAIIYLLIGIAFYNSNGKAANLLSGYNTRSKEERKKHNEIAMCKTYGVRLMIMSIPFIIGAIIDYFHPNIGCFLSWGIWTILFILLMCKRYSIEK